MLLGFLVSVILVPSKDATGTWMIKADRKFPANSMEGFIARSYRLSIFKDKTWQRKIKSVSGGDWALIENVLKFKLQWATGDSDPVKERFELSFESGTDLLIFTGDEKLRLKKVSATPIDFKKRKSASIRSMMWVDVQVLNRQPKFLGPKEST